jgi:predicted phage terminase large subunit-like protein
MKVIIATYESTLATNHALKSRDIMNSEWYRRCWGDLYKLKIDKNVKTEYENSRSGTVITTSVGGTIIGKHGDIIIIDDPNNPNAFVTRRELESVNSWHDLVLSTRMTNKKTSVKIIVMQRIGQGDLSEYVLSKEDEKWEHICLPAEEDANISPPDWSKYYKDGLLDPVRLDREALKRMQSSLGFAGYAGQMQQRPTSPEGNIIHGEWFATETIGNFNSMHQREPVIFFLDTAYTEKTVNDPTGIIATCQIGHTLYILGARKVRMGFPELIEFIPPYVRAHGYTPESTIRVEPKANGISVIQQLRRETHLNVTQTPSPKDSKETRMNAASPSVECGRVKLIEGTWNRDFIDEVTGFPNMKHDEYVDLLCYAIDYHLRTDVKNLKSIVSYLH